MALLVNACRAHLYVKDRGLSFARGNGRSASDPESPGLTVPRKRFKLSVNRDLRSDLLDG
jgi:hypothetical protein